MDTKRVAEIDFLRNKVGHLLWKEHALSRSFKLLKVDIPNNSLLRDLTDASSYRFSTLQTLQDKLKKLHHAAFTSP